MHSDPVVPTPARASVVVRGVELALHPEGDYVSDQIRATNDFFESMILDEIASRITGGVLVDAGAMIGNHTAYLAEFVAHSAIHAFEPWPSNFDLLRQNVQPYATVTVHPQALSDRARKLQMVSEPNLGHSRVSKTGPFEVEAVTLDSLKLDNVSLIKIDVEGHEPQVLWGARDTIARCRPLIVIEDWEAGYGPLMREYELSAEWGEQHQTYLYQPQ